MSEPTRTHPPEADHATRTRAPDGTAGADVAGIVAPSGYEFLGEIGRGGMGIVFRALDLDLGREVAVKVLLPQYTPDSPTARRFLDEARITGRLQHPGIPPVYRVGNYDDGRPYLAMKLIGGQTLEQQLKDRTDPDAGSALAPNHFERIAHGMFDRLAAFLETGRFLAIFEHVAQAVGYAHQEGVIHRDLKPANIMVGAFGEVQVMDWGIARSGDRRPETSTARDGGPAATVAYLPPGDFRTPHSDQTQAGAILGTPAYMPPEQAIGAIDQIGKHSDVFGLGAILCVILTGKPPYVGADAESNRQLAARAKLDDAFARLDSSGAEPELIGLAKRCLAAEPKDRPADAGEVWEAVAAFRADSERRARLAEMDRARAEVRNAEERKRRRIQRALALSMLGLLVVMGLAGWWVDRVQSQRKADREAQELRDIAAANELAADSRERQIVYERDVRDALREAGLRLREGRALDFDLERWDASLTSARFAVRRAEKLLESGLPSKELRQEVSAVDAEWVRDYNDRALLLSLNRIIESNEIRYFFPFPLSSVTSNRFAAAFRKFGIDLLAVPTPEAVSWLKAHHLRDRLVIAIRHWHRSLPTVGLAAVVDPRMMEALEASAAVAGSMGPVGLAGEPNQALEKLLRKSGQDQQLRAILNAVTEDPFTKDWWRAVERRDMPRLRKLVADPVLQQLPSRDMASLAEGLNSFTGTEDKLVDDFLAIARDRFPGEFWVHFRSALRWQFQSYEPNSPESHESYRHLTAAFAIRPTSSVARLALGIELIEHQDNEPAGMRMLESAVEADPTSPWPHLFMGMHAVEVSDWPRALRSFKECIRVDPDTGFFMTSATAFFFLSGQGPTGLSPTDRELIEFFHELIAQHPQHPGGYDLLANYYRQIGDHRSALDALRKAKERQSANYVGRPISMAEIAELEAQAAWEPKLPAVLRGEMKPNDHNEYYALAAYCATFERRFALATRLIQEATGSHPRILENWMRVAQFAGWAVQASAGHGADAATVPLAVRERSRRLALEWIRESIRRTDKDSAAGLGFYLASLRNFAPVRDKEQLELLPAAERAEWEQLWLEVAPVIKHRKSKTRTKRNLAPPPRAKPQ